MDQWSQREKQDQAVVKQNMDKFLFNLSVGKGFLNRT